MSDQSAPGIYDCPVLSNLEVARGIFLMRLHAPEIAAAVSPGQFVNVNVNAAGSAFCGPLLRRPFSVCQSERRAGWISLLWKAIGAGTRLLAGHRAGMVLSLIGPLGRGYQLPEKKGEVILVAGGLGVAPFPLLAEALQSHGFAFDALLGARTAAELWGGEELQRRGGNVHFATDDGSAGHRGFVTEMLETRLQQNLARNLNTQIYACGPMPMLQRVAAVCEAAQMPAQVAVETMMGCGFGICMGCPISPAQGVEKFGRYLLACVDGPVFQAGDIRYDH